MRANEFLKQGVVESYSQETFKIKRRKLNVPALIKSGAIFVTVPHGPNGWETDKKEDWEYSLISLYNVMNGGWPSEAKKYLKPNSYKKAEQQINSSAPNLGSDKLVYDGKYNQILWSIKKLGIPDNVAFLNDEQGVTEGFEEITEMRSRMYQHIKSVLPKWPDYVLQDYVYRLLASKNYTKDEFNREGILTLIKNIGLSSNTVWHLIPNMKFHMDMWEPKFREHFIDRSHEVATNKIDSKRDAERHATQASLANKEGGIRKQPVILLKYPNGYILLEGWHRTIQHFAKYPDGYTGPAYVAVAQNQQGVAEGYLNEASSDEAWELVGQPVPEIQQFVKQMGYGNNEQSVAKIISIIDKVQPTQITAASIPKLKNLANKGNDVQTLKAIQQISGRPDAAQQYARLMQARDAGEGRNRGYPVGDLIQAVKSGNYDPPVLLKLPTGIYVIGGRTRLYAALALGVPANVKIISANNFKQGVAEGSENNNVTAQKIFFARSNIAPKSWSYDHVGFITQDGKQIQMSGHKGNDVYVTNDVTDDPEFPKQNIKIVSLSKPVSVPTTNSIGAENCGTFVANVLQANGVKGIDTQKIYSVFKKPQEQGVAEDSEQKNTNDLNEKWSQKYKRSINCDNPKGFSQRAHCQGRKKNEDTLSEKKRRKAKAKRVYGGYAFYPISAVDSGEGGDGGGLEEGWKEKLAAAGAAGAMALGGYNYVKQPTQQPTQQQPTVQAQQKTIKPITKRPLEKFLYDYAVKAGLSGDELAQFMAQCAHETQDWTKLAEAGSIAYFNKYDIRYNPKTAKILGNTKPGDGYKYRGRGFIHLTGKDNYYRIGKAINKNLVQYPELAQNPEIAAEIALLFWKKRVRPNVDDFQNTTQVTKKINAGLRGLEDRHENYQDYLRSSGNNKK